MSSASFWVPDSKLRSAGLLGSPQSTLMISSTHRSSGRGGGCGTGLMTGCGTGWMTGCGTGWMTGGGTGLMSGGGTGLITGGGSIMPSFGFLSSLRTCSTFDSNLSKRTLDDGLVSIGIGFPVSAGGGMRLMTGGGTGLITGGGTGLITGGGTRLMTGGGTGLTTSGGTGLTTGGGTGLTTGGGTGLITGGGTRLTTGGGTGLITGGGTRLMTGGGTGLITGGGSIMPSFGFLSSLRTCSTFDSNQSKRTLDDGLVSIGIGFPVSANAVVTHPRPNPPLQLLPLMRPHHNNPPRVVIVWFHHACRYQVNYLVVSDSRPLPPDQYHFHPSTVASGGL